VAWQLRPIFLIGAFLPDFEHGSGIGDCVDGGGHCPGKDNGPTPAGETEQVSSTGPGQVEFNGER
jgi:hypothetical protein